jgi:opacity protein-like surface antigen
MRKLVPFPSVFVLLCSATIAVAQAPNQDDYPKWEVFAGYSALGVRTNQKIINFGGSVLHTAGDFGSNTGFETSVTRNFTRHIGLKGDFSAYFNTDNDRRPITICGLTCTTATQDIQLETRLYNFLAGPEFKARNHTRLTPFAYALGGFAHTTEQFSSPGPTFNILLKETRNSFAMALGGGLDLRATKRVSVRASMDYNPVFLSDFAGGRRDFARISLGVLFH